MKVQIFPQGRSLLPYLPLFFSFSYINGWVTVRKNRIYFDFLSYNISCPYRNLSATVFFCIFLFVFRFFFSFSFTRIELKVYRTKFYRTKTVRKIVVRRGAIRAEKKNLHEKWRPVTEELRNELVNSYEYWQWRKERWRFSVCLLFFF